MQRNAISKLKRGFINHEEGNLEITQENNGTITLGTCTQKMSQIISVMQKSCPDLFSNGLSFYQSNPDHNPSLPRRNKRKIQLGLIQGERDSLELLVSDDHAENDNPDVDDNLLPDLRPGNENLENYLLGTDCPLLANILMQLKVYNPDRWSNKTNQYMYTHLLTDAKELLKMCTVKELNIMATELRYFTGRLWFSANLLKAENVNIIVSAFGSAPLTNIECSHKKDKLYQPDTLLTLVSCALKLESYPVEHLQISLGTVIHRQLKEDWYANATCPLSVPIPHEHNSALVKEMEFFSYPEMSTNINQLEPRTFDFTHILTNIRNQILTRGFQFCKNEHFKELCNECPDILSIALVYDKIDTQNAFTAMKMFNYSVERWMIQKGYKDTAKFIRLIRNWHDACNRHGLSADRRVLYLNDMHEFLTQGINFNSVPFQFPEWYVKGMTWQMYEALLQNILTRIQLYYLSSNLTYNARAVLTLSNESFFADLVHYDKESHGYPKGVNVRKVFGRVVLINFFKHKRDRNYFLSATIKGKYEIKLAEHNHRRYIHESSFNYFGLYRNHFFDFPNELTSHRVRCDDITTGLAALCTNPGVRILFKTNKGNIMPEIPSGRQIKGFTLEKNVY